MKNLQGITRQKIEEILPRISIADIINNNDSAEVIEAHLLDKNPNLLPALLDRLTNEKILKNIYLAFQSFHQIKDPEYNLKKDRAMRKNIEEWGIFLFKGFLLIIIVIVIIFLIFYFF